MTRNIAVWLGLTITMLLSVTLTVTAQPTPEFSIEEEILGTFPSRYLEDSLVFSRDGEGFAVVVEASGGQRVVENGENEEEVFQRIGNIRFAPSTNKLFYWALRGTGGNQEIVLVADGDVISTDFSGEGSIFFSNNGEHWAAVRGEENGVSVLLDGELLGRYPDATFPSFSYDGEHFAYLIRDNEDQISLVIDGVVEETYPSPEVEASFHFQAYLNGPNLPTLFSVDYLSDGSLLILTQDEDGWTVYKDDEALSSYLHNIWGGRLRPDYYVRGV